MEGPVGATTASQAKLAKRDSKLSLRSLFGRSRAKGLAAEGNQLSSARSEPSLASRAGSKRSSMVDMGHLPYGMSSRFDSVDSLSTTHTTILQSTTSNAAAKPSPLGKDISSDAALLLGFAPAPTPQKRKSVRKPAADAWQPPSLSQAYVRAIKHDTLPTCSASVDALARLQTSRSNVLGSSELSHSTTSLNGDSESVAEGRRAGRKYSRSNSTKSLLEWHDKIYILITSGHLLQFSADGPADRLPEKVLQLTMSSAVFASDLIPGKHWVLQVAQSVRVDGVPRAPSRSKLSKFSHRHAEKNDSPDFLLVLENAEDMDSWLAILRREIELLGGKKKLSETGKPTSENEPIYIRAHPSQATLSSQDPDRFSRVMSQDFSWIQENSLANPLDNEMDDNAPAEPSPESSYDGHSTAGSVMSADGQRLDNIRNSHSSHRLSYVSSGQRTVTSAGSSPTCSPTRASFSSCGCCGDELHSCEGQAGMATVPDIQMRPNASAILNRRQSAQAGYEHRHEASIRTHSMASTLSTISQEPSPHNSPSSQPVPNFSVPQSARRFSAIKSGPNVTESSSAKPFVAETNYTARPLRRAPPPTTLALSRPLSVVVDQPSPMSPRSPASFAARRQSLVYGSLENPDSPTIFGAQVRDFTRPGLDHSADRSVRRSSFVPQEQMAPIAEALGATKPRKYSSAGNLKSPVPVDTAQAPSLSSTMGQTFVAEEDEDHTHPKGSSNVYMPSASQSRNKRASFMAEIPTRTRSHRSYRGPAPNVSAAQEGSVVSKMPFSQKRSSSSSRAGSTLPSRQPSLVDAQTRSLLTQKSMPHLVEGPPTLPPPTRALPPIPQKSRVQVA